LLLKEISADGYKNLKNANITAEPRMNIFCGENAQGKTNLIEAIWLCSGCRPFRKTKDNDFICFDKEYANITAKIKIFQGSRK